MRQVIRVGGSLLTWNAFRPTFMAWLGSQACRNNVLIAGGGPWVELLRHATKRFTLPEIDAHWNCVKAMSVTAELLSHVTGFPLVTDFGSLKASSNHDTVVLDVYGYMQAQQSRAGSGSDGPLPAKWIVTSDSIAARVATELRATKLVLLKSSDPPDDAPGRLAEMGYVDDYFPTASNGIPGIQFVNLRAHESSIRES